MTLLATGGRVTCAVQITRGLPADVAAGVALGVCQWLCGFVDPSVQMQPAPIKLKVLNMTIAGFETPWAHYKSKHVMMNSPRLCTDLGRKIETRLNYQFSSEEASSLHPTINDGGGGGESCLAG